MNVFLSLLSFFFANCVLVHILVSFFFRAWRLGISVHRSICICFLLGVEVSRMLRSVGRLLDDDWLEARLVCSWMRSIGCDGS